MQKAPDFSVPALARTVEAMSREDIDSLPFGVIALDADGIVKVFNKTEAQLSGYKTRPALGLAFFTDVAPCMNNGYFGGRIEKARQSGTLDISFSFVGDFSDKNRELNVRAQSAKDGGIWIFIQRPAVAAAL